MTRAPQTPTADHSSSASPTGVPARWPAPGQTHTGDVPGGGPEPVESESPPHGSKRSTRERAEWWLRPVIQAETWVAVGYLFVGVVWAPLMFAVTIAVLALAFSLSLAVVGLALVPLAFWVVDGLARIERARATWVGAPIAARAKRPAPSGASWWRRFVAVVTDPTRWRQVAFVMASVVAMPVLFGMAMVPWAIVSSLPSSIWLLGLVLAVAVAGGVARLSVAVAAVAHRYVAWFLGPDASDELQQRVDKLSDQRQAILDAVAAERRRIERNLHDGVQQQLVAIGIDIGRAAGRVDSEPVEARALLDDARDKLRDSIGELRLIGRGLHPSVLGDRGLDAALSSVVAGGPIPMTVHVDLDGVAPSELPDDVATTAYYVVNEAVANVYKHSRARAGSVRITRVEAPVPGLVVAVRDDGRGGANPTGGSGLAGMRARVEGVDGSLEVRSPTGGPTEVIAVVPIGTRQPAGKATPGV